MAFTKLDEGFVFRASTGARSLAAGPRTAVGPTGEVLCTFLTQSKLACNDFALTLCRSGDGGKTWTEQGLVWPHLQSKWSIFASISRDAAGRLFLFGSPFAPEPGWYLQSAAHDAVEHMVNDGLRIFVTDRQEYVITRVSELAGLE